MDNYSECGISFDGNASVERGCPAICAAKRRRRRRRLLLALALLAAGGIVLWDAVKYDLIPKRWGVVEPGGVYRSGRLSTTLVEPMLSKHGIDVVVNLTAEDPADPEEIAEKAAIRKLGIRSVRFPLAGDGTGDINRYAGAIAAIVEARRNDEAVLVHCHAGAQRTGGVVACYQLLVAGKPVEIVYEELQDYDWKPRNYELVDYVNANMGELARLLKEMDVIERIPSPLPLLPETFKAAQQ